MPSYGPNGGNVPFTGFTGTLGVSPLVPSTSGNVAFNGMSKADEAIASRLFDRASRGMRRLLITLIGNAPGGTATEQFPRVVATQRAGDALQGGGLVAIETVNQINRVTVTADANNLITAISRTPTIAFVNDVSGNGGGGKAGR